MLVPLLLQYLETLSGLVDSNLNCGPVLTWMEVRPGRGAWSWEGARTSLQVCVGAGKKRARVEEALVFQCLCGHACEGE